MLRATVGLIVRLLLGIAAMVAILALGSTMGWWAKLGRVAGPWLWWSLFLLLAAGGVAAIVRSIVALRSFIPRYRERRFLARLHPDDGQVPQDEEEESFRQLQAKLQEAIRTLEKAPDRKKRGLALYATPWYLLIGASQSGKTTLLRGVANSFPPFARPPLSADTPTQNCDWWCFNTAIILDTAGRYALQTQGERDSAQWYRFLRLLRSYRALQPINGLIIAMAADALVSRPQEELRSEALELRKRIDEAIRELGVYFPVYLLITRCDTLEGFSEFFGCLPEQTLQQAFGMINEAQPQADNRWSHAASTPRMASMSETLVERLQQLRLSLFNAETLPPATLRQRIFCFPEEFRALQQPLTVFVEMLLAENPVQHRPFLRGVFFTSAQQQGPRYSFLRRQLHFAESGRAAEHSTRSYFLHDLFAVVLPRDQYLVRPTDRAIRDRLFRHLSSFGGCIALCLLLLCFLTQAFFSDRRVHSAVNQEACTMRSRTAGTGPLLEQAEACRQVVQTLMDQNRQRSAFSTFVFNRSGTLAERLRQRYVAQFAAEVLTALDTSLSQHLSTGSEPIPLVFLFIKRIELINQCLSVFGCPEVIEKDLQPDYQLMLEPGRQHTPFPEQVTRLRTTYETYLRWASGGEDVLRREQEAHAERLRRWFSARQFAPRQILLWANQHYAPITAQEYWAGLPTADNKKAVQVDGAYTPAAWKQSILPFLQRAGDAVPDMGPHLQEFQEAYRTQYFEQWRRFLAEFPRGEPVSREPRRRLAVKLLDEHSPYNRVLDVVLVNLRPLLPVALALESLPPHTAERKPPQPPASLLEQARGTIRQWWEKGRAVVDQGTSLTTPEPELPAWVRVLHRYLRSESRKAYLEALQQLHESLSSEAPTEKSFQLVQAAFQEGKPTEKSSHPVLKAWWILSQFRDTEGTGKEEEKVVWLLLEQPVLLVWRVLLDGAGGFLQKYWAENVVAPTRGLSELEQANFVYGPQGKMREFVHQFLKPFLVDNESRPGQVLGEELPLSSGFLKTLSLEKQLRPTLEQMQSNPPHIRVVALRDTIIEGQTIIREDRTELLAECDARPVKITNRAKDASEASASIPWSPRGCGEVAITVFVSCGRLCVERAASVDIVVPEVAALPITKRYPGSEGLHNFIKDFRSSAREFGVNDFASSPAAEEALRRYRINKIRVFYRIEVPSTVDKLKSLIPTPLVPPAISK